MNTGPVQRRIANAPLVAAATGTLVASALGLGLIASGPSAFAVTPSVVVLSSSSYGPQSDGFLYIVGEVQNTSSQNVIGVDVSIGLYNAGGTLIATDDATTQATGLAPGEKSGFLEIVNPSTGYATYKVLGVTATGSPSAPYHRFAVSGVQDVAGPTGVHDVTGTVTNAGYYPASGVKVLFTFYNEAGTVVDVDSEPLPAGALAVSASATFDEHNIPAAINYSRTAILVEGTAPVASCGPCVPFTRVAGATRIETSVAASLDQFPTTGSASAIVLARADAFPDALAGGPLAAHVKAPLLVSSPTALDAATKAEIQRVAPEGATVYVLGGVQALSATIDTELAAAGYKPVRIAGADRFATAVAIAQALGNPTTIFEATGLNFPDALSGGPAAVVKSAAILLTNGSVQAPVTATYLAAHAGVTTYAVGGPAAAADSQALALVGADRYATSAKIAATFFTAPAELGLSTAVNFPDALSAGPDLGAKAAPLLLVPPTVPLSGAYATYVGAVGPAIVTGHVFGGTAAVADSVVVEMQDALFAAGAA